MSRRFKYFSWAVGLGDLLIASVFLTSHPAMNTPSWHYVFLLIPWWAWTVAFYAIGFSVCAAIGTGDPRKVRKAGAFSVVTLILWATEFALVLPAVVAGKNVSWMGFILVALLATFELLYLGMPASKWLDHDGQAEYEIPKTRR